MNVRLIPRAPGLCETRVENEIRQSA